MATETYFKCSHMRGDACECEQISIRLRISMLLLLTFALGIMISIDYIEKRICFCYSRIHGRTKAYSPFDLVNRFDVYNLS